MIVARLLWHLRCDVIAVDPFQDDHLLELGVRYVDLDEALARAHIVTLNCPLTDADPPPDRCRCRRADARRRDAGQHRTRRAGRHGQPSSNGLKSGQIGSLALDVYEEEGDLFFEDRSDEILDDDVFARLLTFPNVLITADQAFLTREALAAIAETTVDNVVDRRRRVGVAECGPEQAEVTDFSRRRR